MQFTFIELVILLIDIQLFIWVISLAVAPSTSAHYVIANSVVCFVCFRDVLYL